MQLTHDIILPFFASSYMYLLNFYIVGDTEDSYQPLVNFVKFG